MSSPEFCRSKLRPSLNKLRGDALLESLIGVFLMGLVGVNTTSIIAHSSTAERDNRMVDSAVHQMQYLLIQNGVESNLCDDTVEVVLPDGGSHEVEVIAGCATASVFVNGVEISSAKAPVVLKTNPTGSGDVHVGGTASPEI